MKKIFTALLSALCLWNVPLLGLVSAADASKQPKPIPQTRPDVKKALEALKERTPRLPLPPLTEEEKAKSGDRPTVNNGRARALYLPQAWLSANPPLISNSKTNHKNTGKNNGKNNGKNPFFRDDPAMTLDYVFKTKCFWIVSRGNNCQYCLGHQEHKLASSGLSDDQIAGLDADWSLCPAREQAAFKLTRAMTLNPHEISDADIEPLRAHFTNEQIVELVYTVAGFNSTNRWTDSLGLPQDKRMRESEIHFNAPTSSQFLSSKSLTSPQSAKKRPDLESRDVVLAALSSAAKRQPRVPVPSQEKAQAVFAEISPKGDLPQWIRVLSLFPQTGLRQIKSMQAVAEVGKLDKKLKAELAWTAARQDRAWYALGHARTRLQALGLSDDAIFALDAPGKSFSEGEREALAFAAKLTASPFTISDWDIAELRKHFSDHEVAEIVHVTCVANMFDRFTETLGLQLEE